MAEITVGTTVKDERQLSEAMDSRPLGSRLLYIDNLRWTMMILVISMHAADTYSPFGNWYFVDHRPLSLATELVFGAWQMYLQSFFMGLLFFIAGYFVPSSYERKGLSKFLTDRAIRLGLPVLLYTFLVGPITEYYVAHSWTSTEPTSFANEWIKHIRNGEFLQENGPLWFCLALLIFSIAFAVMKSMNLVGSHPPIKRVIPGFKQLMGIALIMSVASFLVRAARPPSVWNMHLQDFPQYILLFAAGIFSARHEKVLALQLKTASRWIVPVLFVGLLIWFYLIEYQGEGLHRWSDISGGWHWQSAAFCLWESMTCIALSSFLLALYRDRFNGQGRLSKAMSENAFSVYVFHPPVVILLARLLYPFQWHQLVKFVLLTLMSVVATFTLSATIFRRIPILRRIL